MGRKAAITVSVAAVLALVAPGLAQATAYRYWTYWTASGSGWTFSQLGPASTVPRDGTVEGWRFALSTGLRGQGSQPRISPSAAFEEFCGDETAPSGQKRVAVVFDFGSSQDAPPGQQPPGARGTCVVTDSGATGSEILAAAGDVRVQAGLVCAIGGYPAGECAPAVAEPTPSPSRSPDAKKKDETEREKDRATPARRTKAPAADPPAPPPAEAPAPAPEPAPAEEPATSRKKADPPAQPPKRAPGGTTNAAAQPLPVVTEAPMPSTTATAAPVFTEGEAREPVSDSRLGRALPPLLALVALAAFVAWRWWRSRREY